MFFDRLEVLREDPEGKRCLVGVDPVAEESEPVHAVSAVGVCGDGSAQSLKYSGSVDICGHPISASTKHALSTSDSRRDPGVDPEIRIPTVCVVGSRRVRCGAGSLTALSTNEVPWCASDPAKFLDPLALPSPAVGVGHRATCSLNGREFLFCVASLVFPERQSLPIGVAHWDRTAVELRWRLPDESALLGPPFSPSELRGVGHPRAANGSDGNPPAYPFGHFVPSVAIGVGHVLAEADRFVPWFRPSVTDGW